MITAVREHRLHACPNYHDAFKYSCGFMLQENVLLSYLHCGFLLVFAQGQ